MHRNMNRLINYFKLAGKTNLLEDQTFRLIEISCVCRGLRKCELHQKFIATNMNEVKHLTNRNRYAIPISNDKSLTSLSR